MLCRVRGQVVREHRRVGEQQDAEASSGLSASTNESAAALTASVAFVMLPLASSASTIETGATASWNVSTF